MMGSKQRSEWRQAVTMGIALMAILLALALLTKIGFMTYRGPSRVSAPRN